MCIKIIIIILRKKITWKFRFLFRLRFDLRLETIFNTSRKIKSNEIRHVYKS